MLAQDLPFATDARLLGWQAQDEQVLSPTTLRTLVRRHGELVRTAEREAVDPPSDRPEDRCTSVPLVPHAAPDRSAGWIAAPTLAVDAALAHERPCPPRGIARAEWARVRETRRTDPARTVANLRFLGPAVEEHQVLVAIDEVLTRVPRRGRRMAGSLVHVGR